MNVFIARDGAVIGEYPHTEVTAMARRGELEQEDHYWHEGMEDWLPLPEFVGRRAWEPETVGPPPPPAWLPQDRRFLYGGIAASVLGIGLVGFFLIKPDRSADRMTAAPVAASLDTPTADQVMDKAAADLRGRIERLPASAQPPLNTFYYDVRVNMDKTVLPRSPWTATIHGWENVMDSAKDKTLFRTEFILKTDYEDGEWVYKQYQSSVANLEKGTTVEFRDDENTPIPPSLVGALGLTRHGAPTPQPTVPKVPGFK